MPEREEISELQLLEKRLSQQCELVLGSRNAAIYDFQQDNVYSLNESARAVLLGTQKDATSFWNRLEAMGLAETTKTNTPPSETLLNIPQVGLEFMWLELTNRCNERCLHCYASAGEFNDQNEELGIIQWEKVIEDGRNLGCKRLQFIGGEPLLVKGIFDLAETAKQLDYEIVEIYTNGILLTEAKIQRIKDLGLQIAISLYSIVPELHDAVTQVPGSFNKTFRALEQLKEAGIPTRVGIIAMRQNEKVVQDTLFQMQQMGFTSSKIDVLRPTGRGICIDHLPSRETLQTYALLTKPNFRADRNSFTRNKHWNSCWAGKITVSATGDVIPCIFARNHVVSNIVSGLEDAIYNDNLQTLWKITKDSVATCKDCEYRYGCSDCRPLSEDTYGNLYAKNPRCTYNPYSGQWRNEL